MDEIKYTPHDSKKRGGKKSKMKEKNGEMKPVKKLDQVLSKGFLNQIN